MGIEFLDEPSPSHGSPAGRPDTAAVELPRRRMPRVLGAVAALLVAAVAATVALRSHGTGSGTLPTVPPLAASSRSAPMSPLLASVAPPEREDLALATVSNRLADPEPESDLTLPRGGYASCRHVPAGVSPERAAVRAVRRWYPRFVERDYGQVLDRAAGLCAAELRGHSGELRLLVRVVSPTRQRTSARLYDTVAFRTEDGGALLTCASFHSASGWAVLVGARGPIRMADTKSINSIAIDSRLRW